MNLLRLRPAGGFMLLEVLIAVVILGVGLTALIAGMLQSRQALKINAETRQAAILLENWMAALRRGRYIETPSQTEGEFEEPWQAYRYAVRARPMQKDSVWNDDEDLPVLSRVSVEVSWPAGAGRRSVAAETLLMDRAAVEQLN